jgi:hypothetical protein
MQILDVIGSICFGGAPSLPPAPAPPPPLPDISAEEERKRVAERAKAADRKRGNRTLITNQGGAQGLLDDNSDVKQTLGGS